jgi:hypothetical protein
LRPFVSSAHALTLTSLKIALASSHRIGAFVDVRIVVLGAGAEATVRPPCRIDITQLFALFVFLPTLQPTKKKRERQRNLSGRKKNLFCF